MRQCKCKKGRQPLLQSAWSLPLVIQSTLDTWIIGYLWIWNFCCQEKTCLKEGKYLLESRIFTVRSFVYDRLVDNPLISLYLGRSLRSTENSGFHHRYKICEVNMISDALQTVCKLSLHSQYFFIFKYHFKLIEKKYSKTLLVEKGCNK